MKVSFVVTGDPKAKQRPNYAGGRAYTPRQTVDYENWVKLSYLEQCRGTFFGKGIALRMDVDVYLSIPKSVSKKKQKQMESGEIRPTKKPDSSNVLKAIEDGLNQVAYYDDAQIVDTTVSRYYGENPRVVVEISEVGNEVEDVWEEK